MWVAAFRGCHGCTIVACMFGSNPQRSLPHPEIYAKNRTACAWACGEIDVIICNYEVPRRWDGHPPVDKMIGKYPAGPHSPPNKQCPVPG